MDRQLIKMLIDALAASDLSELEYSRDGATLRLVKRAAAAEARAPSPPEPSSQPIATAEPVPAATDPAPDIIAAPLYGIVHLQRSPDAGPFVGVGEMVTAGQVLCVVEAMKVFTELRAERGGTIAAVLVRSGQEVEAGQALFRMG
jgi:acetyl-CoA carboxylase biotin carboxyl carrier protein